MAGYISEYLANALLDHVFGRTVWTPPVNVFTRLFTTLPAVDGTGGVEPVGGGYAAVSKTNNLTNFPSAVSASKSNGTLIDFGTTAGAWGDIVGAAFATAGVGGSFLWIGPFGVTRTVGGGVPVAIAANGAVIQVQDYISVWAANKLLDLVLGAQAWVLPATLQVKLFTTLPDASGAGGVEVTGGGYSALTIDNDAVTFLAAASQVKANAIAYNFGTPGADWGFVAGFGYFDGSGNQYWVGPFNGGARYAPAGTPFIMDAGAGSITLL